MSLYISQEQLLENRESIKSNTSNKIDTFVGIILLLLSSERISEFYYKANMTNFSNNANFAFTLKETQLRAGEKYWYALFTPTWAERALKNFLLGKKINIDILLSTIFWYRDIKFIEKQKDNLKNLIGFKCFNILFFEYENKNIFSNNQPINRDDFSKILKGNSIDNSLTIKYDGSFIQKYAGDLNAAVFGQTLYSGLEIKKIINVFEFDIIGEFQFTPIFNLDKNLSIKSNSDKKAQNLLLYGVAGVGKSYMIDKITGKNEQYIERIVFHPDYLNTDFVGQIMPTINTNGTIDYQFKAGSFTKVLNKAIKDPNNHYYLVIEEINRGNAPAIFGEIFQLLDRNANGESSYRISHEMIAKVVFDDENTSIYIPSNLTILATMNTADQNVFTLDTAFQRRWTMRMVENDIESCDYKDENICDTGISWQTFNTVMNNHILEVNKDTLSSEDKRLGAFFVRKDELSSLQNLGNNNAFAEKVIKYLWDDVFKFNKSALFKNDLNSLDKVLSHFKNSQGFERFDVFNEMVKDKLKEKSLSHNIDNNES